MSPLKKKTSSGKKTSNRPSAILFHADASDPDMLYFSKFSAFDPYLAFSQNGRKYGISHSLEYGRMKAESAFDEVLLLSDLQAVAAKRLKLPKSVMPSEKQLVQQIAKDYGIKEFLVGARFPVGLGFALRDAGLKIVPAEERELFPERICKTASEVAALKKGNEASAAGFQAVRNALKESKIKGDKLIHQGKVLTSERLIELISLAALSKEAIALHTIAAGGDQACDCHNAGSGSIKPNELIVVDIFPRRAKDG